ncbi:VapE domain-containing protein, partial [Salmonella enterica]|uniref:VapE domain-containing protein n=1 Tax=Salmonella enterica TaxID=28901 RepID=UPI003CEA62F6
MARQANWTANLGDIKDKDTRLTISKKWIMVSDEVEALRRADFDALKDFLTQRTDTFRAPYDRADVPHPRRAVVWGTTNDV